MARVKFGKVTRSRRKRWIKRAKGYYGLKKASYKKAHEQVVRSMAYAFIGRKEKKRDFRKLWITRINAAVRPYGLSYSRFMFGLKTANIDVNRKMLSELAINNPNEFEKIVHTIQKALNEPTTKSTAKPVKVPTAKTVAASTPEATPATDSAPKTTKKAQSEPAKATANKADVDSHDFLKGLESKYATELATETNVAEKAAQETEILKDQEEAKNLKAQMTVSERSQLDGSDSIAESRQELQKHANKLRSLVAESETEIHNADLREMTKKELIKYMRTVADKIAKAK